MPSLIPYSLRKIWSSPANRAPGGLRGLAVRLRRSGAWSSYQLQKQLGWFPPGGRVIRWADGLRVHLLTSSQQSQACLYYGLGDWPSMSFLRRYIRPGDLCADIGANVGTYTLLMARHAGAAQVHSFECLPSNIAKLRNNLRLNQFDGHAGVTVHPVALADRDGLMHLNISDGDSTASISPPRPGEAGGMADAVVQARRLDGFSWPDRFVYIKIDVEGAEQLVLAGAEQLLDGKPPLVWSFELLDTQLRLGLSKAALLDAFASWDYHCFLYQPAVNRLTPFSADSEGNAPPRQDDNVLAIHRSAIDLVARRLCGLE